MYIHFDKYPISPHREIYIFFVQYLIVLHLRSYMFVSLILIVRQPNRSNKFADENPNRNFPYANERKFSIQQVAENKGPIFYPFQRDREILNFVLYKKYFFDWHLISWNI